MKLIVLIVGVAIGFGIGVYWGVHNPTQAASLSAQEEAEFIKTAEAAQQKISDMAAKQRASAGAAIAVPGSSFAGGGAGAARPAVDPDLQNLAAQMQQQVAAMKAKMKK